MLKNKIFRKVIPAALMLTMILGGCAPKTGGATESAASPKASMPATSETSSEMASGQPDTFIADRTVECQIFVDDVGVTFPTDQAMTRMNAELKKRTGMTINFIYTTGNSDLEVMTTAISSGSLPELISYYLDDSSRPEFPILLKAAREGVFTDIAPLIKNTKVYSKYLEPDFLGIDAKNNVMFRPEFNGAAYIVPLNIKRQNNEYVDLDSEYVGGLFIKKEIADAVGVNPIDVKTQDQLYDLLVKIKNGNFKDDNGNPVFPLGPKFWGGSVDSLEFVTRNYWFGRSSNMNITPEGKVLHEAETDYVYKQIDFMRKLVAEGLVNPEFFTMDGTRAAEVSNSGNSAIFDAHNYTTLFETKEYALVGPLTDTLGKQDIVKPLKQMNRGWSIASNAKDPQQIVDLMDYLATREGKLLWNYGIEGEDYDLVDGNPVPKKEIFDMAEAGKEQDLRDTGFSFGGRGFAGYAAMGNTDWDRTTEDFGETSFGAKMNEAKLAAGRKIAHDTPPVVKIVNGFPAAAYMSELPDIEPKLTQVLNNTAYGEMRVQAIFAKDENEVKQIVENYRAQLKASGIEEFEKYLEDKYKADPESINFVK